MGDQGNSLRNSTSFVSFSSIKSSARRLTTGLSPVKQGPPPPEPDSPLRLSTARSSVSSITSPQTPRNAQSANDSPAPSPWSFDSAKLSVHPLHQHQQSGSESPLVRSPPKGGRKVDGVWPRAIASSQNRSFSFPAMVATPFVNNLRPENGKPAHGNSAFGQAANMPPLPSSGVSGSHAPAPAGSTQNPSTVYKQIQEISSKRISTLDYLRKANEGRVYWFNTLLFSKSDLGKMAYFDAKKLARRAANYLLLGLSLPTILDMNATSILEYLRALNALLLEFESYQQIHPVDGSSTSSLSRARIPQMFKRATHVTGGKGRRTSSATDIGLPMNTSDPADLKAMAGGGSLVGASSTSSFPINEQELLPGEEYTHLITPSLPFDPDFFETFSTLCDVLIDCYTRIMSLVPSPSLCVPGVGETFFKADAKLRKIIVAGIVKEFEEASRGGAKNEITSISKVVLGGLI